MNSKVQRITVPLPSGERPFSTHTVYEPAKHNVREACHFVSEAMAGVYSVSFSLATDPSERIGFREKPT